MAKSYGKDPVDRCNPPRFLAECSNTLDCGHRRCASGVLTNFGREIAGTLTNRHDSSPCLDRGQNVVLQPCDAIGFKAGQSKDGGLGIEREVSPTLAAQPSALEPTVCHTFRPGGPIETWIGQTGTTERLGNAFWREVAYTLQTAGGDASPTIIQQKRAGGGKDGR